MVAALMAALVLQTGGFSDTNAAGFRDMPATCVLNSELYTQCLASAVLTRSGDFGVEWSYGPRLLGQYDRETNSILLKGYQTQDGVPRNIYKGHCRIVQSGISCWYTLEKGGLARSISINQKAR